MLKTICTKLKDKERYDVAWDHIPIFPFPNLIAAFWVSTPTTIRIAKQDGETKCKKVRLCGELLSAEYRRIETGDTVGEPSERLNIYSGRRGCDWNALQR